MNLKITAKKVKCLVSFLILVQSMLVHAQKESSKNDSIDVKTKKLDEVFITAVRAKVNSPVTFSNVTKEELAQRNLGQDIPVLLNYLPSVVSTTDAGAGIGYTYMRVRGADGSRINVTLNGIPFNDSESQGTFFVNLPDFTSSLESVQLQRGVGTSTNGAGAFGASLNLQTRAALQKPSLEISNSLGSFNSIKNSLSFGTGIKNNLEFNGRISRIHSDGYIDRASSDMFGYFLNANYISKKTTLKALAFGGKEKTYQAWYGVDEATQDMLLGTNLGYNFSRTYNISGLKMNAAGEIEGFHDNEIDNYGQNHFQLHWNQKLNTNWQSNVALHYTAGKGYFEQYVDDYYYTNILFASDSNLSYLGLNDFVVGSNTISSMDYVRRRWLDNDFYGTTFSFNYHTSKSDVLLGGAANRYNGKHFGEVVWSEYGVGEGLKYYNNYGNKDDVNVYAKASQKIGKFNPFVDLQYRMVFYKANSVDFADVNDAFRFFNPKAGVTYHVNTNNHVYVFAGVANKEPRRDDYASGNVKPERLYDYELGYKYHRKDTNFNLNAFYMNYQDQLVATGDLNNVGSPIFMNSGESYRVGVEVEAQMKLTKWLVWLPNVTYSQNKNLDFYFERDGILQNLGDTNIAFSPSVVVGNNLTFLPLKNLQISLLSKYVSSQYMGNINSEFSKLPSYFVNDFNANYELKCKNRIQSIVFSLLINNLFNVQYDSNGYFYTWNDDFSNPPAITTIEGKGYYPQATRNFLGGITFKF